MEIPLRTTVSLEIGELIKAEYTLSLVQINADDLQTLETDCAAIQTLRNSIVTPQASLSRMAEYGSAINTVLTKTMLEKVAFLWSNSLGSNSRIQGYGILFEYFNVLFNLGALHTKCVGAKDKQSVDFCYAAGVFLYLANLIKSKNVPVPGELNDNTLQFLAQMCLIQAEDLASSSSSSPGRKWAVADKYAEMSAYMRSQPIMLQTWYRYMESRIVQLKTESCLEIARTLHRSRKRADQIKQKAALQKCVELGSVDSACSDWVSEATKMLNEPLRRHDKGSLSDIDAEMDFDHTELFGTAELGTTKIEPIEFVPATSPLFSSLLPVSALSTPFILQKKLEAYTRNNICTPLLKLNQKTRVVLSSYNIPAGPQSVQMPGSVPECLISLMESINPIKIEADFTQCQTVLTQCDPARRDLAVSTDDKVTLAAIATDAKHKIGQLEETWLAVKWLVAVLAQGELATAEFIGLPTNRIHPPKLKSKPMFLEKVENTCITVMKALTDRQLTCEATLHAAATYDFDSVLREQMTKSTQPLDPSAILNAAIKTLNVDIEAENALAVRDLKMIKILHGQCQEITSRPNTDMTKINAVKSLYAAALHSEDIKTELQLVKDTIIALLEVCEVCATKEVARKKEEEDTPFQLQWRPGQPIKFA